MIQAAASSPPSSLALGTGTQPAAGDDAANSGGFANALTASMAPAPDEAKTASGAAIDPAADQASGKAAGKILPDPTGLAGSTPDAAPAGVTARVAPPVASEIILPGLVIPVNAQPAQAAKPAADAPSTAETIAQTVAALLVRAPKSAAGEGAPATKTAKTGGKSEETSATTDDTAPTATATVATAPLPLVIPVAIAVATQPIETKAAITSAARPAPAQAAPAVVTAVPDKAQAPAETATIAAAVPAAAETAAQIVVNFALPQGPAKQTPATAKPTVKQLAARQPDAAPLTPANAQGNAATAKPDTAVLPATPLATAEQPARTAAHGAAGSAKADAIADASVAMPSAEAQPLPMAANAATFAQTVTPVAAAPTTGAAPVSGHDFTALVDRLVEAREAASPQGVHAAISHSEFGQVSLRFDQDANGLSVSMTSADPGFARAVQASAASAGSQTTSDNGSAPRQDTQGHQQQQAAGSSSGQPQSQAQSQAYARDERSPQARPELRTATRQNPETDHSNASGDIFA